MIISLFLQNVISKTFGTITFRTITFRPQVTTVISIFHQGIEQKTNSILGKNLLTYCILFFVLVTGTLLLALGIMHLPGPPSSFGIPPYFLKRRAYQPIKCVMSLFEYSLKEGESSYLWYFSGLLKIAITICSMFCMSLCL